MAYSSSLGTSLNSTNECNICYKKPGGDTIPKLSCCNNSKQICVNCISCLTTPICPYCEKNLTINVCLILKSKHVSYSYPVDNFVNTGFTQFIEEENYKSICL